MCIADISSEDQSGGSLNDLNWEFKRVLSHPSLPDGDFDPDNVRGEGMAVLTHLAEVLGKSRIFKMDLDPALDGTLTVKQALVALRVIKDGVAKVLGELGELREASRSSEVDNILADELAIQIVEARMHFVCVAEAVMETYYANLGDEANPLVQRLRREMDEWLGVREVLDTEMYKNRHLLLPVRQIRLLTNWQSMLRDNEGGPGQMVGMWWVFDEEKWKETA